METSTKLAQEFQSVFGETLQSAIKSGGWNSSYGGDDVDITRPADNLVWSKYGAATAAIRNTAASRCVTKLAQTVARTPWAVKSRDGKSTLGAHDDTDSAEPLTALLHEYSYRNDGMSLFYLWQMDKSITGESYVEIIRDGAGGVDALEFINALAINPYSSDGLNIEYFEYMAAASYMKLAPLNIVYDRYRLNRFSEINGYSPMMTAIGANAVGIMQAAGRASMAYWNNDGLPRSIISPAGEGEIWDKTKRDEIRRVLRENKGAANKYGMAVFPYQFQAELFESPDLQKWAELLSRIEPQIYTAFGVPRAIAGDSDSQRYQSSPMDIVTFHETLTSELASIASVVNTRVLPAVYGQAKPPVVFEFDMTEYRHLPETERLIIRDAYVDGVATAEEYRERIGLPPLEVAPAAPQLEAPAQSQPDAPDAENIITPAEPLVVSPPVRAHTSAAQELEAWRVKAKKRGARKCLEFETAHLDADLTAHIRHALKHDDMTVFARISAVLSGKLPAELPADVAPYVDAYSAHLTDCGVMDTKSAVKTFTLGLLAAKTIQATRLDFELAVETLLFEAVAGNITNPKFQGRMRSLIQTYSYKSYVDGLRDGGIDDLPTEEDDGRIVAHIQAQYEYVRGIADAIYKDGRVTEEEAAGKPEMWFNKSILPAYYAGVESAAKDALFEWYMDIAKENCASCLALSGQRRRMSFWARNVQPKADALMCNGFRCGCQLIPATGAASKGKLPRWQFAKSHGVELEVIHVNA